MTCSDNPPRIGSHFQVNVTLKEAPEFQLEKDASRLVQVRLHSMIRSASALHSPFSECTVGPPRVWLLHFL